jgi:hypothetical protein
MRALILADRAAGGFAPLAPDLLPALVPVAGKPVVQHCIEDLWEAGIRDALIMVPRGDRTIREELGAGHRFGLALRYAESRGPQRPEEALALIGPDAEAPLVVARGDLLRGRAAGALLARTAGTGGDVFTGAVGSRPAGIALLRHRRGIDQLDWTEIAPRPGRADLPCIELGDLGSTPLDGLPDLFDACLGAIEGRYAGLLADGRCRPGSALYTAPLARIAPGVHVEGTARVGRGSQLHDGVELAGRVEIGARCVIDEGAQLIDSVVLPGTYVGRGVRLQNAIAHGAWLYRVDLGTCQRVDDPLLLAGPASLAA